MSKSIIDFLKPSVFLLSVFFLAACGQKVDLVEEYDGPMKYEGEKGAFRGVPHTRLKAVMFPHLKGRRATGLRQLQGVQGTAHFLLDHDLSTGFVHPYTNNFFKRLRDDDYVLKFKRDSKRRDMGEVSYVQKKYLEEDDALGQNLAFFRQWRLSEIAYAEGKINMKPCAFAPSCLCPQAKEGANNPYAAEIPIWNKSSKLEAGKHPLSAFDALGSQDGGTAVIIWTYSDQQTCFWDVHGSLQDILLTADSIARKYGIDPAIAISDAATFAGKIRADKNNVLDLTKVDALSPLGEKTGAGFAYLACPTAIFKYSNEKGDFLKVLTSDREEYAAWKKSAE